MLEVPCAVAQTNRLAGSVSPLGKGSFPKFSWGNWIFNVAFEDRNDKDRVDIYPFLFQRFEQQYTEAILPQLCLCTTMQLEANWKFTNLQ